MSADWTICPTCHTPQPVGERCQNPGCQASGNVPPEILARREKEAAETAKRQRIADIRNRYLAREGD